MDAAHTLQINDKIPHIRSSKRKIAISTAHVQFIKTESQLTNDYSEYLQKKEFKHHDNGNSTDDNLAERLHSDEEIPIPHYDNLSDSHQSAIDEDEEEKMEQEISNRLSHLTINRDTGTSTDNYSHFALYQNDKSVDTNQYWRNETNLVIYEDDAISIDDDEDTAAFHIEVGDEHYQSLYKKSESTPDTNNNDLYEFSINEEFLSNETFLKYGMLYGSLYFASKLTLRALYNTHSMDINVNNISTKVVLISNAIVSVFKTHKIWDKPHKAMLSPIKDVLTQSELNFMDIQKAFHCVMIFLSYFGSNKGSQSKRLSRFYNLICIGCIILIKKYKKMGGLYIYTKFWMTLSSAFLHSSTLLKVFASKMGKNNMSRIMASGGRSSSIMYLLTMIYSRIFLFSKVMVPIIQYYLRSNGNQYFKSIASIAFLISEYYRAGNGLVETLTDN